MNKMGCGRETQFVLMNVEEILKFTNGSVLCGIKNSSISCVFIDSRKVLKDSLFIPLKGEVQDGHVFIEDAIKNGAKVILIDSFHAKKEKNKYISFYNLYETTFIIVEHTLYALQNIAKFYLKKMKLNLKIGVTGSSGKTTCKELLGAIFSQNYDTFISEGNLNSETGLPLSIFMLRLNHKVGIFEMGMNRKGEMEELSKVLTPDVAIITNIGKAHIGKLGSMEAIANEKKKIFSQFDEHCVGFVTKCDFTSFLTKDVSGNFIVFDPCSLEGLESVEKKGLEGSIIKYKGVMIHIHLLGEHNIKNALFSIMVAEYFNIPLEKIKNAIESVKPFFGRAEVKKGFATCFFDCYNANPDSMMEAIKFSNELEWEKGKIYVLGSMLELGKESEAEHKTICESLITSNANIIYLFGNEMINGFKKYLRDNNIKLEDFSNIKGLLGKDVLLYNENEAEKLKDSLVKKVKKGDFVLLKGSRGLCLEQFEDVILKGEGGY